MMDSADAPAVPDDDDPVTPYDVADPADAPVIPADGHPATPDAVAPAAISSVADSVTPGADAQLCEDDPVTPTR